MATRKIQLMHQMFGRKSEDHCKDCKYFMRKLVGDIRLVRKCSIYGETASEASDWCASYPACGLFNQDYAGRKIIDFVKPERAQNIDNEPLEGQIDILKGGEPIGQVHQKE